MEHIAKTISEGFSQKVNYLIEKAQNNLESKRFDLDSISYKTPSVINKKLPELIKILMTT